MKVILLLIVFLVFDQATSCPSGSINYPSTNSCFKFVTKPSYFFEADEACLSIGGHLASVESGFADGFIQGQAEIFFANTSSTYWIGGSTMYLPGNWSWTDGTKFGYTNWGNGQPNPANNTLCLMENYRVGKWYSDSCFRAKPYVCKFSNANSNSTQTTTTARPPTKCRNGWSLFNQTKRCYMVIHDVNFTQALSTCQNFSSNFVSIHSAQENNFVQTLCVNKQITGWCRIGLHEIGSSGNFTWVDGTPLDYTNWYPGNPGNFPSDPSVSLTDFSDQTWYMSPDDQVLDAICAYYL
uniref:C-type lectin domain-containing protein n=1 Tax=Acrobeloides nanus TaxID=290746 RepID=A0A914DUK5_9BILA